MSGNNLSFSITVKNNANAAINALKKQVSSLKSGLDSVGSSSTSTSRFLNSLNTGIGRTTRSFGSFGQTIKRSIGIFTGFKVASGVMNLLTGSMDKALERIDSMDLFSQKMELITHDAAGTAASLEHLQKSTKGTPYALDAAARGVQNFVLRGQSLEQATQSVDVWMDAVSTYGKGTNEQFESVIDAIGKMRSKGTVEMRYLNRMFAAGINPVQMYAQATGQAATDVQNALSHKEITTEEFLSVVEKAMREGTNGVTVVTNNARNFAKTWSATMANMKIAIARGRTELVAGVEALFNLSHEGALKESVLGIGTGIESVFSSVGKSLQKTAATIKTVYNQVKKNNKALFASKDNQIAESNKRRDTHKTNAGINFKSGFFKTIEPQLITAVEQFKNLQVTWASVSNTFAAGLETISKPLGEFAGTYLGKTINGVQDLAIAFGEWLNLKLPPFFEKLKGMLEWLTDHRDGVVSTVKAIIKALIGFSVLQGLQSILIGFNDKLKMINDTLAFFTLGKVQLPTIESIVNSRTEKNNAKALAQLEQENKLKRERNALENAYSSQLNKVQSQSAKDIAALNKNQIKDEVKISNAHKKEYEKLNVNKNNATQKIKQNKASQIDKVQTAYDANYAKNELAYQKEIARINKQKQRDTEKIMKSQQASIVKTNKTNGAKPQDNLSEIMGINLAGDYASSKILSNEDIKKKSDLFDDIYDQINIHGTDYTKSPILTDIYNSRKKWEDDINKASDNHKLTKNKLAKDTILKRDSISNDANRKLDDVLNNYNIQVQNLKDRTKKSIGETRTKYQSRIKGKKNIRDESLDTIQGAYEYGLGQLDNKPKKQNFFEKRGFLSVGDSFKYVKDKGKSLKDKTVSAGKKVGKTTSDILYESGLLAKNGVQGTVKGVKNTYQKAKTKTTDSYQSIKDKLLSFFGTGKNVFGEVVSDTKNAGKTAVDKVKGTTGKAIVDTAKGFEKFSKVKLSDIADDFKNVGKSTATITKNTATNTVKGTTSGAANFFSTMFEGFTNLKRNDLTPKADFKGTLKKGIGTVKSGAKSTGSGIGNFFGTMFEGFGNLKKNDKTPKSNFRGTIKKGWDFLNTDAQGNKTFTKEKFSNFFKGAGNVGKKAVTGVKSGAKATGSGIGNFFGTMFSGFSNLGKKQTVQLGVEGAEEATVHVGLFQKVLDKLKGAVTFVTEGISNFSSWLVSLISSAGAAVLAVVGFTAAIGALTAGLGVFNPDNKLSDAINNFFSSFSEWCSTFAKNAPTLIQSFVTGLIKQLPQLVTQGTNLLLSLVNGVLVAIPKMLTVGASVVFSLISGLLQVLPELVYQGFNAIGQFIAGIIQNLPNLLSAAWELIQTLAQGIVRNLPIIIASGIKLIWSLITGIVSMVGQVGSAVIGLISDAFNYLKEHPEAIGNAIKSACEGIMNALNEGLWAAADMFHVSGFLEDVLQMQRPETMTEEGVEAANNFVRGASESLEANKVNVGKALDRTDIDATKEQAGVDGKEIANQLTDSMDTELAQEAIDAGAAGMDTATNYVDGVNTGIAENGGSVDTSVSGLGQEGLATLSVNFNSEQVAAAAGNLINNLNNAINANAPNLYMTMAVVAQNCITQLSAGFAVGDNVPSGIAEAMTGVVKRVGDDVRAMCDNIRSQLTDAKNISEQTSQELATEIEKNFETAKVGVGGSLQQMKNSLVTEYDEMRAAIYTDLSSIAGFHEIYSAEQIEFYETTVTTGLQRIKDRYSELDRDVRNRLNALKDFHKQVATDAMQGMIDGLESKRPAVASKEGEIVQLLKDTFEDGLGIHSPSRWGEWVGQMIVLGMVQGLSEGGKLGSFVSAIINDMRESFKNGQFKPEELVDYMGQEGTMKVIKYLELIGDQTIADVLGDGGTPAIVTEALKYVGYAPGGGNSMFGLHYGNAGAWCASFVRYCAEKVGVPFPPTNYVPDVLDWSIANGRYTQTPQAGYAAIFGGGSHIELVAGVGADGTVDMVGGNTGMGEVKHRPRNDATSYVVLDGGHSTLTLKDTILRAYNQKFNPAALLGGSSGGAPYNPSAGVAQWRDIVLQALAMLGQPSSLVDDVLYAIECESSGNPNAINLTDSNAAAGHPSQGLLQTIPETFAAYRNPNLPNNITDPLANVYAALNYMIQRYGSIENVINPRRGGWSGYEVGTRYVPNDMLAMIHKDEAIIPKNQNPYSESGGNYLYDLFSNVMSNDNGELTGLGFNMKALQGSTTNNNNSNVTFSNNFEIHNSNNVDADRNISNMEAMFVQMLRDGRAQGVPR